MFQKRLKKELNKIEVPAYDTHKYKETIAKAKKIKLHPENLRMSSTEFFCNQLRFIKTETWILKIIVSALVLYLLITEQINISSWFWTLIAISGPILCLINAKELCNVFQPGMLEIQITAKNSFSKVLMVRLTIFGLFDLLFFMTMALGISMLKQTVIEISCIPRNLIIVIFYYQISLKPLKTLSLSQVSFPLLFPLYYIVPPVFTNSDKGKYKGKKIL